jgi:hypothetical protein
MPLPVSIDTGGKARKTKILEPGELPVFDKHPVTYEE